MLFARLAIRLGRFLFFPLIGFTRQTAIPLEACLPLADDPPVKQTTLYLLF